MTEQEVKKHINRLASDYMCWSNQLTHEETLKLSHMIHELEEYRKLGSVKELNVLKSADYDCSIKHLTGECSYNETGCSGCIGREKIKIALEKQIAKKTFLDGVGSFIRYWHCPICKEIVGTEHKYCHECGQRLLLDWGNEDAE